MYRSIKITGTFLGLLTLGAVLWGCKKERSADELSPQEETQIALAAVRGDAQAGFHFDDAFDNALGANTEVGYGGTGIFGRTARVDTAPACLQVTVERLVPSQTFPVRYTLDFGSACAGRDGRTRSGKVIMEYTARLVEPGARATISFDHYTVDSLSIQGTQEIRNISVPGGPQSARAWTVTITNGRIDRPNGTYVQWNGHRTIQQVEGMLTPNIALDDAFTITGGASGSLRTGNLVSTWTSTIEQPLRKKFTCRWFTSGTIRTSRGALASNSAWAGLLDYGQGNCDNAATLTLNNSTYQISLP